MESTVSQPSTHTDCAIAGAPLKNFVAQEKLCVERAKLLQALGYPARAQPAAPVIEICEQQAARIEALAQPWGSWREVNVEAIQNGRIRLAGGRELASLRLSQILSRAEAVIVLIVTLGEKFTKEVRRLSSEGSMLEAMALDASGTVATNELMNQLRKRACREAQQRGYGATIRYGPGYTGWELRDMAVLFSYFDREDAPVRLNPQMMMTPEKSLLNLVGLTSDGRVAREPVPCRICDLENCSVRREPYRKAT